MGNIDLGKWGTSGIKGSKKWGTRKVGNKKQYPCQLLSNNVFDNPYI